MMEKNNEVYVWDRFVRSFHWLIVGAFTVAFVTEDDQIAIHVWAGYAAGVSVILRALWGVIGSRNARFSNFVTRPRIAFGYVIDLFLLRAKRYLGHSPGGGAMVILLLVGIAITVATGLVVYGAEDHAGPLAGWYFGTGGSLGKVMAEFHEFFATITLVLVIVHVCGVLFASLVHGENLVRSMISGFKRH